MPELPEVETIRRQLAPTVQGARICHVRVTHPRAVRAHHTTRDFIHDLEGRTILEARRRGKALLFPLDADRTLIVRLGMSGQMTLATPETPLLPHTHVVLTLSTGQELRYIDPRTFGSLTVVPGHDPALMREFAHYGPEPLDDAFTPEVLAAILRAKRTSLQTVLMDQSQVAGIGKIYADEACFLAGLHPLRPSNTLTDAEIVRLHAVMRDVLTRAIDARGTSSLDAAYRDASGQTGEFQQQLHVYQRANRPCRRCGTLIEYRPFQGRRIHFCPQCQR